MNDVWITTLRDRKSGLGDFRHAAHQIGYGLAMSCAQMMELVPILVKTPLVETSGSRMKKNIVLVPILRAGLAILNPFMEVFPNAKVAFLGLKRNEETAQAEAYYQNIPKLHGNETIIILDPMLATGGSALMTCQALIDAGANPKNMMMAAVIAAPEGKQKVVQAFPEVDIVIAQMDSYLNEQKFIVPGLGDFGDRYFGTEE